CRRKEEVNKRLASLGPSIASSFFFFFFFSLRQRKNTRRLRGLIQIIKSHEANLLLLPLLLLPLLHFSTIRMIKQSRPRHDRKKERERDVLSPSLLIPMHHPPRRLFVHARREGNERKRPSKILMTTANQWMRGKFKTAVAEWLYGSENSSPFRLSNKFMCLLQEEEEEYDTRPRQEEASR
ncbi:hypothetical protein CSUI_008093, partial [Cystoisospora suis]